MANVFCVSNPTISHPLASFASLRAPPIPNSPALHFAAGRRKPRGSALEVRAGPSTSSIVFSIAIPLSLLAVTVVASVRIADKLDQQWLEEMANNEALMEDDDSEDDNEKDDMETYVQEEPALPSTRNRPKREA